MVKARKGSQGHAEALLSKLPKEATQLLSPEHPIFQAVLIPATQDDTHDPEQAKAEPAADGRDLERMKPRTRARCSVILASLMCGKTHRGLSDEGFPWAEINSYLSNYPSFKALYRRSLEIATEYRAAVRLEEAHSRAVDGWEEPIYFQGRKCGSVRRFSDKLLSLLLAGDDPKRFSPHKQVDVSHTHETGDRLTSLLKEIAARGRFDPIRDLPGNARYVHDVEVETGQMATKRQPEPFGRPKTPVIEGEATDSVTVQPDSEAKTDISEAPGSEIRATGTVKTVIDFGSQ